MYKKFSESDKAMVNFLCYNFLHKNFVYIYTLGILKVEALKVDRAESRLADLPPGDKTAARRQRISS